MLLYEKRYIGDIMQKNRRKKIIKSIVALLVATLITVVASIMIKYYVEGETNMPFNLSKIMIISNAQGMSKEDSRE